MMGIGQLWLGTFDKGVREIRLQDNTSYAIECGQET